MALRLSARVVGLDKAKADLRQLPKAIRNRAMRRGFSRIGALLARDVKAQIPGADGKQRTGQTKKSIGVKIKLYRTSGNIMVSIGPRSGFTVYVKGGDRIKATKGLDNDARKAEHKAMRAQGRRVHIPGKTFHFIDSGSSRIRGRRYLLNAFNRNKSRLPAIMQEEVRKALASYASSNG